MAFIDRIKYDGYTDGNPWMIFKYPGEKFVLGSQLIVNQGQEALFFKGGEALDLFGAGTHTLKTGNLPLLNKLVNLPFGGQTPFSAEVYFVNKTSKLDMNWGTSNAFQVEDPKYGIILSIRSHGKYGLKILDARMFVTELIGALTSGSNVDYQLITEYFSGLVTNTVKSVVAGFMVRNKISFLEVTAYLKDLSIECQTQVAQEFERFGIEIQNFYIEAISPPKDEFEKLRNYKEEMALGAGFYQQRRSFDVMEKMAENPNAGGIANAGIGLGMGLGIAQNTGNLFGSMASNMTVSNQAMPDTSDAFNGNTCQQCGFCNPEGQKFCGNCGSKLVLKCSACGTENQPGQKFCGNCGAKL